MNNDTVCVESSAKTEHVNFESAVIRSSIFLVTADRAC